MLNTMAVTVSATEQGDTWPSHVTDLTNALDNSNIASDGSSLITVGSQSGRLTEGIAGFATFVVTTHIYAGKRVLFSRGCNSREWLAWGYISRGK